DEAHGVAVVRVPQTDDALHEPLAQRLARTGHDAFDDGVRLDARDVERRGEQARLAGEPVPHGAGIDAGTAGHRAQGGRLVPALEELGPGGGQDLAARVLPGGPPTAARCGSSVNHPAILAHGAVPAGACRCWPDRALSENDLRHRSTRRSVPEVVLGEDRVRAPGTDQRAAAARRLFQTSNATARSSTMPLTTCCVDWSTPMSCMPFDMTAMMRPPTIAPVTVPMPPVTAAPPMKQAAMASSSNMLPAAGWAALDRAENTTPATEARKPMFTNIQKLTRLTRTPDSCAAARLPPMA